MKKFFCEELQVFEVKIYNTQVAQRNIKPINYFKNLEKASNIPKETDKNKFKTIPEECSPKTRHFTFFRKNMSCA